MTPNPDNRMSGEKNMKLKRLLIEREYYGPNKGLLIAKIAVDDDKSEISMTLSPEASLRLVQVGLDELVRATEIGASELKAKLIGLQPLALPQP